MPASRPTVKQAIELLKIHQLRRENAAIYEQFQNLRNEVATLHDAHDDTLKQLDETQTHLDKTHSLSVRTDTYLSTLRDNVSSLARGQTDLRSSFTAIRDQHDKKTNDFQAHVDRYVETLKTLEIQNRVKERDQHIFHKSVTHELAVLLELIESKIDKEQIETLQGRLQTTEKHVAEIQDKQHNIGTTSRSCRGKQKQGSPLRPGTQCQHLERSDCDDHSRIAEDINSVVMLSDQSGSGIYNSTIPNDVDLDEGAADISYTGHDPSWLMCNDSFVMLQYQAAEVDTSSVNCLRKESPYVLVRATESLEQEQVPEKDATNAQKPADLNPLPRRSKRLAAKSQAQSSGAFETESQAVALNSRIALAAKGYKLGTDLIEKRRGAQRHTTISQRVAQCREGKGPVATRNTKRIGQNEHKIGLAGDETNVRPDDELVAMQPLNRGKMEVTAVEAQAQPTTPTGRVLPRDTSTSRPQNTFEQPSSPLYGRQAKSKGQKVSLKPVQAKSLQLQSPYLLQPLLLPRNSKYVQHPTLSSSDADVFLPQPQRPLEHVRDVEPLRKKQRQLRVPPPPEIPILPTSVDEDFRFDQW